MPKRKHQMDANYEYLHKKLKEIEKELQTNRKKKRVRVISSSESSEEDLAPPIWSENKDLNSSSQTEPHIEDVSVLHDLPVIGTSSQKDTVLQSTIDVSTSATPRSDQVGNSADDARLEENERLTSDVLEILGIDPSAPIKYGQDLQKDLAVRLEHHATTGLTKEVRKELTEKYLVPGNCKLIDAPALNPETKAALSEMVIKRDKVIESKQRVMASAMSSLGQAISLLISSKDTNTDLLRLLMDTSRLLCDCQHNDTITRRNFIIFSVKKEMKDSLQNTKVDKLLFGQDLTETLKTAKAINKSGADFKVTSAIKAIPPKKNLQTLPKNWKTSRRPTVKTKETPTTSYATRSQRTPSSKTSSSSQRPFNRIRR